MENNANKFRVGNAAVLLAVLTLFFYWPALRLEFVNYDDPLYFTQNAEVLAGLTWQGVVWAFTTVHASNWHPLTWLSLMTDVQLFGTAAWGPHLTNVLLHGVNSLLLLGVLWRLTGQLWPSGFVAGFFALHPLHVESVAWVSERKDVLSGLFWLLSLWFYAGYAQRRMGARERARGSYLAALICFALGLLSKPMVVTLPLVLLLLDVWPLRRVSLATPRPSDWAALLREKIPFFLLTVAACGVTFFAQSRGGAVASLSRVPLDQRITNAATAYVVYLRKMVWPDDLAVFYPHPGAQPWPWIIFAALLLALITGGVVGQIRWRPWLAVGWFWYVGTLIPVIGLVQVGDQAYADRYTYVPLIGIFVALIWSVAEWTSAGRPKAMMASLTLGALLIAGGLATHYQLRHWENSETLFRRALAVTEKNYLAHHSLAFHLATVGRTAEAQYHYEQALAILPTYYEAHLNLGLLLLAQGSLDAAAEHFLEALRCHPDSVEGHYNYGVILGRQGREAEAMEAFQRVLALQPDHLNAHYNLGLALAKFDRPQEAEFHYREALRLGERQVGADDARLALPHYQLGLLLQQQGRDEEAREHFDRAARLRAPAASVSH